MDKLKPEIIGKHSEKLAKNAEKQQPTENRKNTL